MAYNNVSFYEAEKILTGKENNRWNLYDRYQKPKEWPSLPTSSRNHTTELQIENANRSRFQEKKYGYELPQVMEETKRKTQEEKSWLQNKKLDKKRKEKIKIEKRRQDYTNY